MFTACKDARVEKDIGEDISLIVKAIKAED
jgi:hypothetical protein